MKFILKLAVVALVANMTWHVMTAYVAFFRFKDAVHEASLFGNAKNLAQLKTRVLELAADYSLPLGEDDVSLRRERNHTITEGAYTQPIDLLPWYTHPWTFTFHIDTFSEAPTAAEGR